MNDFSMYTVRPDGIDAIDLAHCRDAMRIGSKSFYMASCLLPPEIRDATLVTYAFCRLSDDTVDDLEEGAVGLAAVDVLRLRLDKIYADAPIDHPVDRALAATVRHYKVPRDVLDALLEGMAWDAEGRDHETIEDVIDYSVRVAGSVGMLICCIMNRRDAATLARACDLGIAMQITNICRDVGEDAGRGRIYLPAQWMRDAGIDSVTWLRRPRHDERLARVIERMLETADEFYQRAETGVTDLPIACRPAIYMARHCYAEIGQQVRRHHWDSVSRRAVVSSKRKLWMLTRVFGSLMSGRAVDRSDAVEQAAYLVDGISLPGARAAAKHRAPWWRWGHRLEWTIDLFIRLEELDRLKQAENTPDRRPV